MYDTREQDSAFLLLALMGTEKWELSLANYNAIPSERK